LDLYTPYSSTYSTPHVILSWLFITGLVHLDRADFIVTIHNARPGLTWFRLPLFIWAHYATDYHDSGQTGVAITIVLVALERAFRIGS